MLVVNIGNDTVTLMGDGSAHQVSNRKATWLVDTIGLSSATPKGECCGSKTWTRP